MAETDQSPADRSPITDHRSRISYVSTTNACKLCKPLGACLVFRGIEGAIPYLHGSQGCATYMRRYIISHFREPMDIASSSLGEKQAVYGGGPSLKQGLRNVIAKYRPALIGVATTCLTETIGDDVPGILAEFREEAAGETLPALVRVSTPSYSGTHAEGFHAAVRAVAEQLGEAGEPTGAVNLFPGSVSPADLRHLKELLRDFGLDGVILPDLSETLDGPALQDYEELPRGGTPVARLRGMGRSRATLEFGRALPGTTAGAVLARRFGVPLRSLGLPVGLRESDRFFRALEELSGRATPREHALERGRLVDAYVDGHKVVSGVQAVVYGEEDLVVGLAAFLAEIGVRPVLCASGGRSGRLAGAVQAVTEGLLPEPPAVREGADFYELAEEAEALGPQLLVGNSKGYHLARRWQIPLVRVGFPIHDRFGGQRLLHLGYRGAQSLYDRIVNALLEVKQEGSAVGYGYL
ncbi:MAG: nitrogenase component 1 [Thermodesulfobacteriota bacterium]